MYIHTNRERIFLLCGWKEKMKVILDIHKNNKYEALGMIRETVS